MLELKNVSFQYGDQPTLQDISLTVSDGEFLAIVGHNGAGKSTLLKLFNGLIKPTCGDVLVNGMNTKTVKTSQLARHIGFLFQNPDRQICQNNVYDEIAFNLRCMKCSEEEIQERCNSLIARFGFRPETPPFHLSRGQRQQLALASLMAARPEIMILDEPTTGLDYQECMDIMQLIRELNENGTTVIMVSHDMEIVSDFAKRALVLSDGRLLADGSFHHVIRNREAMKAAGLLPPQITQLAQLLGGKYEDADTISDMLCILREAVKK